MAVLVGVSELFVSEDELDDVDDVDVEDTGEMVVTEAAGSEKVLLVVEGIAEEVVAEIEDDEELVEAMAELVDAMAELVDGLGWALPTDETTTPWLRPKRLVDV